MSLEPSRGGYLLIGIDNTARKQVEAERVLLDQRVRDQQFYMRSLIGSNIDALITTDVHKQTEAPTRRTRDELIGAPGCQLQRTELRLWHAAWVLVNGERSG